MPHRRTLLEQLRYINITCAKFAHNKNYTPQDNERRDSFVPAKRAIPIGSTIKRRDGMAHTRPDGAIV